MAEYVAFDPNVEVVTNNALMMVELVPDKEQALAILSKHGMNLTPEVWTPLQNVLHAFKEINQLGFFDLVAMGMRVPDFANFPPEINTVETALHSLDVAYKMNHRGGDIVEFRFEKTGDRSGKMICRNA